MNILYSVNKYLKMYEIPIESLETVGWECILALLSAWDTIREKTVKYKYLSLAAYHILESPLII